jgi:hypothetical protein
MRAQLEGKFRRRVGREVGYGPMVALDDGAR